MMIVVFGPIIFALLYYLFVGEGGDRIFSALVVVALLIGLIWENHTLLKKHRHDDK